MVKIFVNKQDAVSAVIEHIMAASGEEVTLVLPKGAQSAVSLSNFSILKREAEAVGKRIFIESVDEEILALARAATMPAHHPFLHPGALGGASLSDIVVRPKSSRTSTARDIAQEESEALHREHHKAKEEDSDKKEIKHRVGGPVGPRRRIVPWLIFGVLCVAGIMWAIDFVAARATVAVVLEPEAWDWEGDVSVRQNLSEVVVKDRAMPGEVFFETRNLTQFYPATGAEDVSKKAEGRVIIYNAYSSEPQTLVATTRFETEDGHVYRLLEQVTVPGAIVKDSQITPASIGAKIVADKPGVDYNRGGGEKLTIPGFKGTPKFIGFYGVMDSASGGFVGRRSAPVEADIASARIKILESLKMSLETALNNSAPEGFRMLTGSERIEELRYAVNKETDERGNFSVFIEGKITAMGFRDADESDLIRKIMADAQAVQATPMRFSKLELRREGESFSGGATATYKLLAHGEVVPAFSENELRASLLGVTLSSAEAIVRGVPGVREGTKVSVFPFWKGSIPKEESRVRISVDPPNLP